MRGGGKSSQDKLDLETALRQAASDCEATRFKGALTAARFIPLASPADLRCVHGAAAKRFQLACGWQPSLPSALFLRALLAAFPGFRQQYASFLLSHLEKLLQLSAESDDEKVEGICVELWADEATNGTIERAVLLLRDLIDQNLGTRSAGAVRLGTRLFAILRGISSHAANGSVVPQITLDMCGRVLSSLEYPSEWKVGALRLVAAIVSAAGWAAAAHSYRISHALVAVLRQSKGSLDVADECLRALGVIGRRLKASSLLHPHLMVLAEWKGREGGVGALSAVIETAGSIVKRAVLLSVQERICLAASRNPSPGHARLLSALLAHGHDGVPLPIHIARFVALQLRSNEDADRCLLMVHAFSRPRTLALGREVCLSRLLQKEQLEEKEGETMTREKRRRLDGNEGRVQNGEKGAEREEHRGNDGNDIDEQIRQHQQGCNDVGAIVQEMGEHSKQTSLNENTGLKKMRKKKKNKYSLEAEGTHLNCSALLNGKSTAASVVTTPIITLDEDEDDFHDLSSPSHSGNTVNGSTPLIAKSSFDKTPSSNARDILDLLVIE